MKRLLLTAVAALTAAFFMTPGTASAVPALTTPPLTATVGDYTAGAYANGIMLSRHNLGGFGRVLKTDDTTQVCVFCHTPHHSNTSANPLWNRSTANSVSYIGYGTTIAGTVVNKADLGGATLACLSCHDGVTTFDSLVNAPGKGGVVPGGDTTKQWRFDMPGFDTNFIGADHFGTSAAPNGLCAACHNSASKPLFATGDVVKSLSLDFDLTNDHPVSIPYSASTKASLRPMNTTIANINLSAGLNVGGGGGTSAIITNNLSQNRWAISGFISSSATIGSLLRNSKVECSSCHDPHFRNLSYDEADKTYLYANHTNPDGSVGSLSPQAWCGGTGESCSDGFFLRRVGGNTGSGVCRTCHDK